MVFVPTTGARDEWWGCLSFLFHVVGVLLVVPGLTLLAFRLFGVPVGTAKLTGPQGTAFLVAWMVGNGLWAVLSVGVRRWDYGRRRRPPGPWARAGGRLAYGLVGLVVYSALAALLGLGAIILYDSSAARITFLIGMTPLLVLLGIAIPLARRRHPEARRGRSRSEGPGGSAGR